MHRVWLMRQTEFGSKGRDRYADNDTTYQSRTVPRSYGAEVVLYGDVYDEACAHACELAEEKGYTFIHPFDDPGRCNRPGYDCNGNCTRSFLW